jgi:dolichol-phosphate mannosyltransferase
MAIDHARHHSQVLGVDNIGRARDLTAAVNPNDGIAFDEQSRATDWFDASPVDQGATTDSSRHEAIMEWREPEGRAERLVSTLCCLAEKVVAATAVPRSLVVLPTYNERENVESIVTAILGQSLDFDVLVVDDNSPDGTGQLADTLAQVHLGRVHVLHRPGKQGLGTAYIEGFLWALSRAYEFVFEMDADFSHDPADLLRLRQAVAEQGADASVGSRWVPGGGTRNWSFLRTFISRGGSIYARAILRIPVNDLTSGFKCFSRRVLERLDLQSVRSNGYAFQVEMNYRCYLAGFRVVEVPITFVDRRVGKSKMGGHIVTEAMLVVLRLRLQTLAGRGPQSDQSPPAAAAKYSRMP